MANGSGSVIVNVDEIIDQLLQWTITKERKMVHLKEKDIEYLCKVSAEIFLSEPSLLELEGPLTVAGRRSSGWIVGWADGWTDGYKIGYSIIIIVVVIIIIYSKGSPFRLYIILMYILLPPRKVIYMDNTTISFVCLNKSSFHPLPNISSLGIMWIEDVTAWKWSVCCFPSRSSIQVISQAYPVLCCNGYSIPWDRLFNTRFNYIRENILTRYMIMIATTITITIREGVLTAGGTWMWVHQSDVWFLWRM